MSAIHTSPPPQGNVLFPHDGSDGASASAEEPLAQRLSLMKAACESFASEIAGELKSICSILGATSASDASSEAAPSGWEAMEVRKSELRSSPVEAAPPVEARGDVKDELKESAPRDALKASASSDAGKGHDRLAALKERLAEKLRCESNEPARDRPSGDFAFAGKEDQQP